MVSPIVTEMTNAPIHNLFNLVLRYNKRRWFVSPRDSFSWVYGFSEVEIQDFATRYNSTLEEIRHEIEITNNEKLKEKLSIEFENFPALNYKEFILDTVSSFWLFTRTFKPLKKIRMTIKFNDALDQIKITSECMINYTENAEWLEIEKGKV